MELSAHRLCSEEFVVFVYQGWKIELCGQKIEFRSTHKACLTNLFHEHTPTVTEYISIFVA